MLSIVEHVYPYRLDYLLKIDRNFLPLSKLTFKRLAFKIIWYDKFIARLASYANLTLARNITVSIARTPFV